MIELIYNEEEESAAEERILPEPKNVKQVGEPKEYKKIFIEDYVHTFLLQYSAQNTHKTKVAVLLGTGERAGGKRHLYIKSALPTENVTEKLGKYCFSEKVWGDIYQECEKYFPEQEIVGWFLATPGFLPEKTTVTEETHRTYFSGADKVLFMIEPLEGESAFFGYDGNRFAKQSGYYIYYEKNDPMREFLLKKNERQNKMQEHEKPDVAMANFRKILQEKQEQNVRRKRMAASYGVKTAVALLFLAGALALKNQTDKIQTLERQISENLPQEEIQEIVSEEVVVEELPGNVEEKQEAVYEEPTVSEEPEEAVEEIVEEPVEDAAAEVPVYEEYTVQAGDTLAKISRDYYGTDEKIGEICELNGIQNGDYIQEGEIILLP